MQELPERAERDETVLGIVARALAAALLVDDGELSDLQLIRDVTAATKALLPDVTSAEILDAIRAITTELRRETDGKPIHTIH